MEIEGGGVTFVIPEKGATASSHSSAGGLAYQGPHTRAMTDGKTLTVNGQNYGSVRAGDVVDLRKKGVVEVNDLPRSPQL